MNKQQNPPDLTAVLKELERSVMVKMNCVNVGVIQDFDSADQTASVRIGLKKVVNIEADGTKVISERPVLLKCPVVIMGGGGTYITHPISAGDECVVLFNDRELDNFWATGEPSAPNTGRVHVIVTGKQQGI